VAAQFEKKQTSALFLIGDCFLACVDTTYADFTLKILLLKWPQQEI
jgi:hypothetical protein